MTIALERRQSWLWITALGCVAFTAIRFRTMLPPPHYGAISVIATIAFAVAQEAIFRGFLYTQLERFGPTVAVAAAAAIFALFHVPRYGWGVLPIDFAAGLLFGWQRWASRTWTAPAATHVVANLVQLW